jgi:hypothetical protein
MDAAAPVPLQPVPHAHLRDLWSAAVVVAAVTFVAFGPSLGNGLTSWDDATYVTENSHLGPISLGLVRWAFTDTSQAQLWIPVTWLSLAADVSLFGPGPFGHHLVNVLLHALNGVLVLLLCAAVLEARTGEAPRDRLVLVASALGALSFALHPLRVESVSWVVERKDLLCGAGALAATLAHLRAVRTGSRGWRHAATALLAVALLSKPLAVAIPLAWLVLDVGALGRRPSLALVTEKAAAFAAAAIVAVVTAVATRDAMPTLGELSVPARLIVVLGAPIRYLWLTAWPAELIPYVPLPSPGEAFTAARLGRAALTVVAIALLAWRGRRVPGLRATALAWLVLHLPNLGILHAGFQEVADRFTYLPAVALAAGLSFALLRLLAAGERVRRVALAVGLSAVVALGAITVRQQGYWRDSVTLWRRAVEVLPECTFSLDQLAGAYHQRGDTLAAIETMDRFIAASRRQGVRGVHMSYWRRAVMRVDLGQLEAALADVDRGLQLDTDPALLELKAMLLVALGRLDEARAVDLGGGGPGAPAPLHPLR